MEPVACSPAGGRRFHRLTPQSLTGLGMISKRAPELDPQAEAAARGLTSILLHLTYDTRQTAGARRAKALSGSYPNAPKVVSKTQHVRE
jgi:hypothetical protein